MVDWKDISTAPKDGTEFQAWGTRDGEPWWAARVKWNSKQEMFQIWGSWDYDDFGSWGPWQKEDMRFWKIDLTHWDSLPLGPNGEENEVYYV